MPKGRPRSTRPAAGGARRRGGAGVRPDPDPRALFRGIADDLAETERAFDAELMLSALLGMVYGSAGTDRAAAVTGFAEGLGHFAREERAIALWASVDALLPNLVPGRPAGDGPAWEAALAEVRPTGTYAYGDIYGDQVSYLATFAYADEVRGGPQHAVVTLLDHNLGFAKDVFVGVPAAKVLASARELAASDPLVWFREVSPARLRAEVTDQLAHTDLLATPPESESFTAERAFALARLGLLPDPDPDPDPDSEPVTVTGPELEPETVTAPGPEPAVEAGRDGLAAAFRSSPASRQLAGADASSLEFCLDLIVEWADRRDGEPLRWSPTAVEFFLLDWAPRATLLDETDIELLPRVLDAWVVWAGHRRKLPAAAVRATRDTIGEASAEFARLAGSGEARGPAAQLVAQMVAEGVDPTDTETVERWVARHNAATDPD